MKIEVRVRIGRYPNGRITARVIKGIFDDKRVVSKSVLSISGKWLHLKLGDEFPDHTEYEVTLLDYEIVEF